MAHGITEAQVHLAADELVAHGERPTVDRIRAHLGTGSPNTVTRWLESWWEGLAARLAQHRVRHDLPHIPEPVANLAAQGWEMAMVAARAYAQAELATEREGLDAAAATVAEHAAMLEQQAAGARAELEQARQEAALARQHVADLQRLSAQQTSVMHDLTTQRDSALERVERAEQQAQHLRQQLDDQALHARQ